MRKTTLLLAAIALAVVLAAIPAQAATTFTVNATTDAPDANPGDGACSTAANECTALNGGAGKDKLDGGPGRDVTRQ